MTPFASAASVNPPLCAGQCFCCACYTFPFLVSSLAWSTGFVVGLFLCVSQSAQISSQQLSIPIVRGEMNAMRISCEKTCGNYKKKTDLLSVLCCPPRSTPVRVSKKRKLAPKMAMCDSNMNSTVAFGKQEQQLVAPTNQVVKPASSG